MRVRCSERVRSYAWTRERASLTMKMVFFLRFVDQADLILDGISFEDKVVNRLLKHFYAIFVPSTIYISTHVDFIARKIGLSRGYRSSTDYLGVHFRISRQTIMKYNAQ